MVSPSGRTTMQALLLEQNHATCCRELYTFLIIVSGMSLGPTETGYLGLEYYVTLCPELLTISRVLLRLSHMIQFGATLVHHKNKMKFCPSPQPPTPTSQEEFVFPVLTALGYAGLVIPICEGSILLPGNTTKISLKYKI